MSSSARQPLAAWRNEACAFSITVPGLNLTGEALRLQARMVAGTPGAALIDLATVTSASAEGLRLASVTTTNGVPTSTVQLRINKSTLQGLPYAGELGDPLELAYALQIDGVTRMFGPLAVLASAIDSDGAPADRPVSYGARATAGSPADGVVLTITDTGVTVSVQGVELLAPLVVQAQGAADAARNIRDTMPTYFKGDPGGDVMATGPLASLGQQTIAGGTNLIKVDGTAASGDAGAGRELALTTIDPATDPLVFADKAGRRFRQAGLARDLGIWVTWFGAKCDGVLDSNGAIVSGTDDTAAVQAAVNYAYRAGATDIWFPEGVCIADNIVIPATSDKLEQRMIRFRGVRKPIQLFGTVGTIPVSQGGSVVKCRAGAQGAVFVQAEGPFDGFSITFLEFLDLRIVTYDAPQIDAIDASHANTLIVKGCQIDTGVYSVQASQPAKYSYKGADQVATGIRTPARGNGAIVDLIDTAVSGYYVGATINEHTRIDRVRFTCNLYDMEMLAADHPSLIGRVACQRSTYAILVSGQHRADFAQVAFEDPADSQTTSNTAWQKRVAHVVDPNNWLTGQMRYTRVLGGTGYAPGFIAQGASGLTRNDVGAPGGSLAIFTTGPTTQSVNNAAATAVTLAATAYALSGFALDASDASLIRCTTAGLYEIDYTAGFDAASSGAAQVLIYRNNDIYGRNQAAAVGFASAIQARAYFALSAGDTIHVVVYQNSGAALNLRQANGAGSLNIKRI